MKYLVTMSFGLVLGKCSCRENVVCRFFRYLSSEGLGSAHTLSRLTQISCKNAGPNEGWSGRRRMVSVTQQRSKRHVVQGQHTKGSVWQYTPVLKIQWYRALRYQQQRKKSSASSADFAAREKTMYSRQKKKRGTRRLLYHYCLLYPCPAYCTVVSSTVSLSCLLSVPWSTVCTIGYLLYHWLLIVSLLYHCLLYVPLPYLLYHCRAIAYCTFVYYCTTVLSTISLFTTILYPYRTYDPEQTPPTPKRVQHTPITYRPCPTRKLSIHK